MNEYLIRLLAAGAVLALLSGAPQAVFAQAHQPPKVETDDYAWQHVANPYGDDAEAIEQGRSLYRRTCYICHLDAGGRGPNLRKSALKGQDFMRVVLNGKKNTQMPAWKGKLSEEDMWKILAYLEASPAK
jgi:mono/diheme cytochrome c family protein